MFCEACGSEIDKDAVFCPNCGMPVNNGNVHHNESVKQNKQYNHEDIRKKLKPLPKTYPNTETSGNKTGLILADGEVIVTQYNCANVYGARGYLTVTNKRLLFNAHNYSSSSRLSQEITLSSVSGLSSYYGYTFRFGRIIAGAIMGIMGLMYLMTSSNSFEGSLSGMAGLILTIIAGVLIFLGIKKSFLIAIYAKDVSLSPIVVGEGPNSFIGNSALLTLSSDRTKDTDKMLNELGAVVQDLQSMGDLAIEKWQNKADARDLPAL